MKEFDLEYVKQHWDEAQEYGLIQTRHGESVRLTCYEETLGERPIVGIVKYSSVEVIVTWRKDGCYSPIHNDDPNDLVIKE